MKRQDKLELVFASLIAISVIVSLIFAIAIVSPEQGVLQGSQSNFGLNSSTNQTSVILSTDTVITVTTVTASATVTLTLTSLIPVSSAVTASATSQQTTAASISSTTTSTLSANSSSSNSTTSTQSQLVSQSATSAAASSTSGPFISSSTTTSTLSISTSTTTTSSSTSTSTATTTTGIPPTSTTLSLSCTPSEFQLGVSTLCTSTITSSGGTNPATGLVSFASSLPGSFSPSECTLQSATATSCSTSFTPKGPATGYYTVTATYLGDTAHLGSSGSSTLIVSPPAPTQLSCYPTTVAVNTSTYCVVTVTNSVDFPAPTGTVSFSSNMPGSFSTSSCTLDSTGSCSVSYTPGKGSVGFTTTITATYSGDTYHARGSVTAALSVTSGWTH